MRPFELVRRDGVTMNRRMLLASVAGAALSLGSGLAHAASFAFSFTVRDVSGNCALHTSQGSGVLSSTGQPGAYQTTAISGVPLTFNVPGTSTVNYSFPEGGGTSNDQMTIAFDEALHSIAGTVTWTHSNGCYGVTELSGIWTGVSGTTGLPQPPAAQTAYAAPSGKLSDATAEVVVNGTYGSANVSVKLDVVKALQDAPPLSQPSGFAAGATYSVYVVALVPGALLGSPGSVWFMRARAPRSWESLVSPIAAFLEDAEQAADTSNRVVIEIVSNTDLTGLIGTEIYVGYGTSDTEMLAAGRYRGVYKVL